jgi:hypothetical protein
MQRCESQWILWRNMTLEQTCNSTKCHINKTYCTLVPQCHLMYNNSVIHAHILGILYLGEIHSEISYSLVEFQFRYFRSWPWIESAWSCMWTVQFSSRKLNWTVQFLELKLQFYSCWIFWITVTFRLYKWWEMSWLAE